MAIIRYIPEVILTGGCRTCPYFSTGFDGDDCSRKRDWLRIPNDNNVARNLQIDPNCPLPTKEI